MGHALASLRRAAIAALLLALTASAAFAQTTTITAAWDRNTDSYTAGYIVYYGTAPGSYQWTYDAGNQVTAAITLSRGAVYYLSVRAYNTERLEGPGSIEASVNLTDGTPSAPTAQISASLASPTSALVSWQTTNAVSATINGVAVGATGSATVPISATTTFTLVAVGASGATATSQATVTLGTGGAPAPVAQISAGLAGDYLAQVSWQAVNAVSATLNGNPVPLSGTAMVPLSTVRATFTLVATSATGATATQTATTLLNPGPATARLTAAATGGGVQLAWLTTGAVSATLNGIAVPLTGAVTVPVSTTTTFTLVAANAAGATATDQVTVGPSAGAPGAPGAPGSATATVVGSRVTVSWSAPAGAAPDSYLLYAGTSPGSADLLNGYSVGNVLAVAGDLPPGRYYAAVRAANSAGVSAPSATVIIEVGLNLAPPSGFTVTWRGATAILTWSAAGGATRPTSYTLEAGTVQGATNIGSIALGDVTTFQVDVPPGRYFVRLRAVYASGQSAPTADLVLAQP